MDEYILETLNSTYMNETGMTLSRLTVVYEYDADLVACPLERLGTVSILVPGGPQQC